MTDKDKRDDETSFADIVNFSSMPPPARDVHNAATAIGQLSEEMLASLRAGQNADAPPALVTADELVSTRKARAFELPEEVPAPAQATAPPAAPPVAPAVEPPALAAPPALTAPNLDRSAAQPDPVPPHSVEPRVAPDHPPTARPPVRASWAVKAWLIIVAIAVSAVLGWRYYLRRH